ncbi:MAG: deoxyribodipyrimidine photo-lyase [Bacillota bacterium]
MDKRIKLKNKGFINEDGKYVLYWMQHTQRIHDNGSLIYAIREANRLDKPLKVLFVISKTFPEGADRHYHFMLEGLHDLRASFKEMGVDFTVELGKFLDIVPTYLNNAALMVMDKAYTRELRALRNHVVKRAKALKTVEVESDLSVPVELASNKLEYAARTIRKKLWKALETRSTFETREAVKRPSESHADLLNTPIEAIIEHCDIDHDVKKTERFKGGESEALRRFDSYIENKINRYSESNDPGKFLTSELSPYLHFGMLSPMHMLKTIENGMEKGPIDKEAGDAFLEQLIVRRELAFNFVYYHKDGYDAFDKMTVEWAYKTMRAHKDDQKDTLYSIETLINANTDDPYWNACMREMVDTGYMHNYMRMYWGKQIIKWSPSFEEAYERIKTLNNRYFLDGRDPNSFAGVAWCFGRHDRAFQETKMLGKLRPMTSGGIKRKFDMEPYMKRYLKK